MFTRIVVGVDCREGGRDALALATLLQSAGGGELVAVYACAPAPLLHEDAQTRVQAELARTGTTARATRRHRPLTVARLAHHRRPRRSRAHRRRVLTPRWRRARPGRRRRGGDAALRAVRRGGRPARLRAPRRARCGASGSAWMGRPNRASRCRLPAASLTGWAGSFTRHHGRGSAVAALARHRLEHRVVRLDGRRGPSDRTSGCSPASLRSSTTTSCRRSRSAPRGRSWSRAARTSTCSSSARAAYGPVRRLLLGSTSTKLARHAACPLLDHPAHDTGVSADTPGGPVIRARASRTMSDALRSEVTAPR